MLEVNVNGRVWTKMGSMEAFGGSCPLVVPLPALDTSRL